MVLHFEAKVLTISPLSFVHIPTELSQQLPSRGMLIAEGTINQRPYLLPLEPDGNGSHFLILDYPLIQSINTEETLNITLSPSSKWIEAEVPSDLKTALISSQLELTWNRLSVKARWAWIRWIRATNNPATREKRISTACDMLQKGKKRPCCFDHSQCTIPELKKGLLQISM